MFVAVGAWIPMSLMLFFDQPIPGATWAWIAGVTVAAVISKCVDFAKRLMG